MELFLRSGLAAEVYPAHCRTGLIRRREDHSYRILHRKNLGLTWLRIPDTLPNSVAVKRVHWFDPVTQCVPSHSSSTLFRAKNSEQLEKPQRPPSASEP